MATISESRSREIIEEAGIPVSRWETASNIESANKIAQKIGFPVAVKLNGESIAHKTEQGLVRLNLKTETELINASNDLLEKKIPETNLLVTEMLSGSRELIAGMVRDPQFGPCVMLGFGGIFAEAVADVEFRLAPVDTLDAVDLINSLKTSTLLGEFRGEKPLDRDATTKIIESLGSFADKPEIQSIDLNPLIIVAGKPIAADALIEL